jgi:hypothetical protein
MKTPLVRHHVNPRWKRNSRLIISKCFFSVETVENLFEIDKWCKKTYDCNAFYIILVKSPPDLSL